MRHDYEVGGIEGVIALAVVGIVALLFGFGWLAWYLFHHVVIRFH